jgi:hypothetical protein
MGQAVVDLPDTPAPPAASAASTDDLLAQMAGEEIDRLLAEAEGERPAGSAAAAGMPPLQPLPFLSPPVVPPEQVPESNATQLRGFLGGLASDSGPDPVTELAASSRAPAAGKSTEQHRSDPLADEDSSAERAALASSASNTAAGARSVNWIVRVLAWINSPLDSCPDHIREAIGKIAILTAVNAVAIVAYVVFLRHH